MTFDLKDALSKLNLTQAEVGNLLDMNIRTVNRWANGDVVPKHVEQVLKAWLTLQELHLPWRPDGIDCVGVNLKTISTDVLVERANTLKLNDILDKVKARGGPSAPWVVNIDNRMATLGPMWVSFCMTHQRLFLPVSYGRNDETAPNLERDRALIEDAYACISAALAWPN